MLFTLAEEQSLDNSSPKTNRMSRANAWRKEESTYERRNFPKNLHRIYHAVQRCEQEGLSIMLSDRWGVGSATLRKYQPSHKNLASHTPQDLDRMQSVHIFTGDRSVKTYS